MRLAIAPPKQFGQVTCDWPRVNTDTTGQAPQRSRSAPRDGTSTQTPFQQVASTTLVWMFWNRKPVATLELASDINLLCNRFRW